MWRYAPQRFDLRALTLGFRPTGTSPNAAPEWQAGIVRSGIEMVAACPLQGLVMRMAVDLVQSYMFELFHGFSE
jgi:hypothetical protein